MVSLSVLPHQSGPVNTQHHMKVVDGHVVNEHVIGALEEGGIDSKDGDGPLLCHASRHGDGTALGDAYIEEAVGAGGLEMLQPSPGGHGRRNGTDPPVLPAQPGQGPAEDGGEVVASRLQRLPSQGIEGRYSMESVGILLRR